MLGGGNPVGGAIPAGVGSTLSYIGDFVYANSGVIAASETATKQLEFTTSGNSVIVGKFNFNGSVSQTDEETGNSCIFVLSLNGEVISMVKVDTLQEDMPANFVLPVIIPPQSKILITALCSNTVGQTTVNLTGRVYQ
tara:strand:- start:173 stop:586 length:414 start_codon:yes stop_codon:yes gene_type:complete